VWFTITGSSEACRRLGKPCCQLSTQPSDSCGVFDDNINAAFEMRDKDGPYADLSGNLTSIGGSTLSDVSAAFGLGVWMSGQCTCPFANWPDRLNAIATLLTVAFPLKPSADSVTSNDRG